MPRHDLLLVHDHGLDGCDHARGDLDLDHVRAKLPDRLLEADVALVDAKPARLLDRVDDLLER